MDGVSHSSPASQLDDSAAVSEAPAFTGPTGDFIDYPDPPADNFERGLWFCISLGCSLVLITAMFLTPDARGHGTHEQLGLPQCGLVEMYDRPCPSCGFTTTFTHAAHLQWWQAFKNQPFGFVLFLLSVIAIPTGMRVVIKRHSILAASQRWPWKVIMPVVFAGWLGGWAYKWYFWIPSQ